jgi:hypothetical protein
MGEIQKSGDVPHAAIVEVDKPEGGAELAIAAKASLSVFAHGARLAHLDRVASIFARSNMIPERFRGKKEDCAIAIAMAWRHGCDELAFMNGVYIVHGTPGMESKLAVALANQSGIFRTRILHRLEGAKDVRSCTAYATLADTGEVVETTVDMDMAKAEGWTKNSKWTSMRDHMLKYRSSMFLIRQYAPEILCGMMAREELDDMNVRAVEVEDITDGVKSRLERKRLESGTTAGDVAGKLAQGDVVDVDPPSSEPDPEPEPEDDAPAGESFELQGEQVDAETGEFLEENAPPAKDTDPDADPFAGKKSEPPAKKSTPKSRAKTTAKSKSAKKDAAPASKPAPSGEDAKARRDKACATYVDVCQEYNERRKNIGRLKTEQIEAEIQRIVDEGSK